MGILDMLNNKLKKIQEEEKKMEQERQRKEQERQREIQRAEFEEELKKQAEIRKIAEEARKRRERELKNEFKIKLDSLPLFKITLSDKKHNRNASFYAECKNITKATPLKKIKDFIAVDTETTGLKAAGNDIIQLSAIKFINFEPTELFSTYIKPRKPIPMEASSINGITDDMVENAPKFYEIIDSFNEFIGDLPLVAHNAPFDMKHLYANGLDSIENKIIYDTLALSKKIITDAYSYKLQSICEDVNIYFDNAHNANADSLAAGLLFVYLCAERKELSVEELLDFVDVSSKQETIEEVSMPTINTVSESIIKIAESTIQNFSCIHEDKPDFLRLHIYTSDNNKIGAIKIMKSDLSITFRKFENGIPTSYDLSSAEDIRKYL